MTVVKESMVRILDDQRQLEVMDRTGGYPRIPQQHFAEVKEILIYKPKYDPMSVILKSDPMKMPRNWETDLRTLSAKFHDLRGHGNPAVPPHTAPHPAGKGEDVSFLVTVKPASPSWSADLVARVAKRGGISEIDARIWIGLFADVMQQVQGKVVPQAAVEKRINYQLDQGLVVVASNLSAFINQQIDFAVGK